jgi:hypothetical protein
VVSQSNFDGWLRAQSACNHPSSSSLPVVEFRLSTSGSKTPGPVKNTPGTKNDQKLSVLICVNLWLKNLRNPFDRTGLSI